LAEGDYSVRGYFREEETNMVLGDLEGRQRSMLESLRGWSERAGNLERFGSHLAMETRRSVSDSTFDDQVTTILTESLLAGKDVHFRDKIGGVSDTFLGKREC
jgi:hypothetical protein